jgi:arginine N-succinyltransferase
MSFRLREVRLSDLRDIFELAQTFSLLNLPADESVLHDKLTRSVKSFRGQIGGPEEGEYVFVVEDTERHKVVATSLIISKHGTEEFPHIYFDVLKRERYSRDMGVGFIHQVLKLSFDSDGPTEIGGLLVSDNYRGRPEKIGKQISLVRFLYMAMHRNRFEERVLCELTPPLGADQHSDFWEALGRKFTGLPYQEADYLSRQNKEFIRSLFPEEDIYTSLLDAKARYVIGRVGPTTMPAKHLLESIGFKYLNQIDPFDGGPHFGAKVEDITLVKKCKSFEVADGKVNRFEPLALVGIDGPEGFRAVQSTFEIKNGKAFLPDSTRALLDVTTGDKIYLTTLSGEDT